MYLQNETNIIISGMASSGTSITALIIAYMLNKKFLYAGKVHKFIAEQLGYDTKSKDLVKYEQKYGEKWDLLWEKYIVWKAENTKNLLVDAKLAGFFIDHQPWLFEVYIKPDIEARLSRASHDNRTEDILSRDKELSERWKKLYSIDVLDENVIRENYDYILDNSNLTIAESVFKIYEVMRNALGLADIMLLSDIKKIEKIALIKGKQFFYEKLTEKDLLISYKEIFNDWINNFESDLENTLPEWNEVVINNT